MPIEDFTIRVYCEVCAAYERVVKTRCRGFSPALSDQEVLTLELVGSCLGYSSDKTIWEYFVRHWQAWFPALGERSVRHGGEQKQCKPDSIQPRRNRMRKTLAAVLSCSLFALSSAYAQQAPDSASVADREWRALVEPLLPLGEKYVPMLASPQDAQLRQEVYRQIFSALSAGYLSLNLGDAEHPDFWPIFNMAYPQFAANPDDAYYLTSIDGTGVYKISGYRGTVRFVDFQIGGGQFYPRGQGYPAPIFADYDLDALKINKDGSFEVVLSTERPAGYKGNWWKLDPKAVFIFVRQVSYDWLHEVDGRFAIERLDRPAIKPRQTAAEIDTNLKKMVAFAEGWTDFSFRWLKSYSEKGLVNKVVAHSLNATGGLTTQIYIEGQFDIRPDEALIYETAVPKRCRYWNIQLTENLWDAIDYMNRQSTLNGHTARLDKDGKFRAVISATDPGVPNWLDTAGYEQGTMFGRWTQCGGNEPTPNVTKVKLADVRKYLPADTPMVSAEARDATLRLRRKGAQLRRRW